MATFSEQFREVIQLGGLRVGELEKRVLREIQKDNVLGYAAQLAYYFLFSLFPFFLSSRRVDSLHSDPEHVG